LKIEEGKSKKAILILAEGIPKGEGRFPYKEII